MTYEQSDQHYEKRAGIFACACLGPMYGEPYCACEMARQGLPLSIKHVEEMKDSRKRFDAFCEQFYKENEQFCKENMLKPNKTYVLSGDVAYQS